MKVVWAGFLDLSGWFLALEISCTSILKPDLLKELTVVRLFSTELFIIFENCAHEVEALILPELWTLAAQL